MKTFQIAILFSLFAAAMAFAPNALPEGEFPNDFELRIGWMLR